MNSYSNQTHNRTLTQYYYLHLELLKWGMLSFKCPTLFEHRCSHDWHIVGHVKCWSGKSGSIEVLITPVNLSFNA